MDNIIARVGVGENFFQAGASHRDLAHTARTIYDWTRVRTSVICRLSIRETNFFLWKQLSPPRKILAAEVDFLPLQGTDYVEFYVGNAKQAAHFYKTAFGFQSLAYAGPETGTKDRASYVIRQNKLTFVLTTPLRPDNPIADHIYKHGDGVKVIALKVEDATSAWNETTKRGGKSFMEPVTLSDDNGEVVMSGIHTYGDTVHLFIERMAITPACSCRVSGNGSRPINPRTPGCCMSIIVSGTSVGTR